MRKPFAAFAVTISVVPGILIMLVGIGPEPEDWSTLVGTLVIAAGLLSLLVLFASRNRLEKRAHTGAGKDATLLIILAVALLVIFFPLFRKSFVGHRDHGTVFFPLWITGRVKDMTKLTGGRYQLLDRYGNNSVAELVRLMPNYEWAIVATTALLLILYQGAISALSSSFLLLPSTKREPNLRLPLCHLPPREESLKFYFLLLTQLTPTSYDSTWKCAPSTKGCAWPSSETGSIRGSSGPSGPPTYKPICSAINRTLSILVGTAVRRARLSFRTTRT